jgi:hypothetical protein
MKWWMVVAVVASLVSITDASEAEHPRTIDVQMTSLAHVPAPVLEQSRNEVTRIFADAGLAVRWTETAPRFTVQIVAQILGFDRAVSPVMGVALRKANGSMVQVFFRQVQDFARSYQADLGRMLGYVIAHEIGHLLLPGYRHSPTGVMQAEWDKKLVRDAARGLLTFTPAQAAIMRASR